MIWILYDLFICILYRILFFIYMYNMSHHSMCTFDHNLKISKSSLKYLCSHLSPLFEWTQTKKKKSGKVSNFFVWSIFIIYIHRLIFNSQRLLHDADEQLYAIISLYVYLYIQLNKHNWFQQILMYILECFNIPPSSNIFLVELFWRCKKLMVLMSCERLNSHAYWKLSPG
jgi:hypothetical protein